MSGGSLGNRVLKKRNRVLELAFQERNRTISRMTSRIYDLNKTTDYIITKLEKSGLFADAEILRMATRKLWR